MLIDWQSAIIGYIFVVNWSLKDIIKDCKDERF